jgi:hypothetical protein
MQREIFGSKYEGCLDDKEERVMSSVICTLHCRVYDE